MLLRCLLFACLALVPLAGTCADELPPPPKVGTVPPQVLGKDTKGNPIDLGNYRGKITIVTFWASWCGPCRRELPVLGNFQSVVGRDALEVIAVNFKEPRDEFRAVVRANRKLELTYVHDQQGRTSDAYGVNSLPHMFILDHEGKVAFTHRGYSEESLPGIVQEILSLLPDHIKNRPPANSTPAAAP